MNEDVDGKPELITNAKYLQFGSPHKVARIMGIVDVSDCANAGCPYADGWLLVMTVPIFST